MHAFDFIVLFFSFVYAAAIAHVLSSVGEIVIEAKRIRLSWLNGGWMLVSLLGTASWWISMWDLHEMKAWTMPIVGFFFLMASAFYVLTRMVSPRIPHDGEVDLQAFHRTEGPKYMVLFGVLCAISVATNTVLGQAAGISQWLGQNVATIPMVIAAGLAAAFPRRPVVQVVCLVAELAAWTCYYGVLQAPLKG